MRHTRAGRLKLDIVPTPLSYNLRICDSFLKCIMNLNGRGHLGETLIGPLSKKEIRQSERHMFGIFFHVDIDLGTPT